ncbi:thiamine diphosphokinase [Sphingobacterium spiritivorum]|uniref:Thiamine diphosphokinase n=1 Tax=Sphingobacterium spiritivorum ATCC 33861 TaxID=525373 RepID=D7VIT5_SPHSI|nr:hypothetical protein [Sphingobacterium spiritivorum]EFK59987.1 hypothetical protein HMPREF0766_10904 [Sphingobacterium spiritivorum ATCC 33861]QQT37381.1 thiamine diphosphokinase [Sphingobacterium spiritivorum]WQD34173.1 thiamine diphosphokinase [Sphingobacterium spiritivorum]SUI96996.1 Uncharacterised protein [Sphingobacterium spiritivorum]
MSSHHIVRENQEPALLIDVLDAIDEESLGQLLEWSPTLISSDASYDVLESLGIKVDILFLHDSVYDIDIQEHTRIFPVEQSYISSALQYLVENGHRAVNVITDHIPFELLLSYADNLDMVIISTTKRTVLVKSPYEKWKSQGEILRVVGSDQIHTSGLTLIGDNRYKTSAEGFFKIEFEEPTYLFIEEER